MRLCDAKNDSRKVRTTILKEKAFVLEHFHCNKGIFSGSRVPGPGSQGLDFRIPGLRVSGCLVSGSHLPGLGSENPESRVSGLDFRLCSFDDDICDRKIKIENKK